MYPLQKRYEFPTHIDKNRFCRKCRFARALEEQELGEDGDLNATILKPLRL